MPRHRTYDELKQIQDGIFSLLMSPTNNNAEDRKVFMRVIDILFRKMHFAQQGCQEIDACQ